MKDKATKISLMLQLLIGIDNIGLDLTRKVLPCIRRNVNFKFGWKLPKSDRPFTVYLVQSKWPNREDGLIIQYYSVQCAVQCACY